MVSLENRQRGRGKGVGSGDIPRKVDRGISPLSSQGEVWELDEEAKKKWPVMQLENQRKAVSW